MNIFENKTPMPASDDPSVVRTAQTWPEARTGVVRVQVVPNSNLDVVNRERPRRGHAV